MRILGVDPGGKGALALMSDRNEVEIVDMPVFKVKHGRTFVTELDVFVLIDVLARLAPDVCYFERTGAWGNESAKGAYNFGRIAGACEALVKSTHAEFHWVTPQLWKRRLGVPGKGAEGGDAARALASQYFPRAAAAGLFKRKMDDGRADAALIAWFGRSQMTAPTSAEEMLA